MMTAALLVLAMVGLAGYYFIANKQEPKLAKKKVRVEEHKDLRKK